MILVKSKLLSYNEAACRLKALNDELEEAREERADTEEKLCELEGEVANLSSQVNEILDQMRACDLTNMLPTYLLNRGFKLTEVSAKASCEGTDFWGSTPPTTSQMTVLEDGAGNVIREWAHNPFMADLFEVSV